MSTAVYRRVPSVVGRLKVFEQVKVYRDASGAAAKKLEPVYCKQPLNFALDGAVTEVKFLESETLHPQPVDLTLTNKHRDTDPYLTPIIKDLLQLYFKA